MQTGARASGATKGSRLAATLREAPVVRLLGYEYFVHPITDGVPRLDPSLLDEVVDALCAGVPRGIDVVLTPEAMGIPVATGVSLRTKIPFTVARKRTYGLPGEIVVDQRTGYGTAKLCVHGLGAGARVLIIDDVVSTGGTLRALAEACRRAGASLVKVLLVVNKNVDLERLGRELGAPIEALVRLRVVDGHVVIEE